MMYSSIFNGLFVHLSVLMCICFVCHREIAFNDRYNGVWSRPEVTFGGDQWPDFTVGERFIISVAKVIKHTFIGTLGGRDTNAAWTLPS